MWSNFCFVEFHAQTSFMPMFDAPTGEYSPPHVCPFCVLPSPPPPPPCSYLKNVVVKFMCETRDQTREACHQLPLPPRAVRSEGRRPHGRGKGGPSESSAPLRIAAPWIPLRVPPSPPPPSAEDGPGDRNAPGADGRGGRSGVPRQPSMAPLTLPPYPPPIPSRPDDPLTPRGPPTPPPHPTALPSHHRSLSSLTPFISVSWLTARRLLGMNVFRLCLRCLWWMTPIFSDQELKYFTSVFTPAIRCATGARNNFSAFYFPHQG